MVWPLPGRTWKGAGKSETDGSSRALLGWGFSPGLLTAGSTHCQGAERYLLDCGSRPSAFRTGPWGEPRQSVRSGGSGPSGLSPQALQHVPHPHGTLHLQALHHRLSSGTLTGPAPPPVPTPRCSGRAPSWPPTLAEPSPAHSELCPSSSPMPSTASWKVPSPSCSETWLLPWPLERACFLSHPSCPGHGGDRPKAPSTGHPLVRPLSSSGSLALVP